MICCPKSFSEFAEGGSEIIAIFHRETPVIASAAPPNTTVVFFRCKAGVNMSSLESIIMLSVNLRNHSVSEGSS